MSQDLPDSVYRFIERICMPLDHPRTWPRKVRFWYLFTFPFSMPLHLLYCGALIALMLVAYIVVYPISWAVEVYHGDTVENIVEKRKRKE